MQTPRRHYLTQHRRQRLVLWALAMLMWIASVLASGMPTRRHLRQRCRKMSIHALTRMVKHLILLRAADIAGIKRTRRVFFKRGRDLRRPHLVRSILGSKLRRALKRRDLIQRIAILTDALINLDAWAARFAKRLGCGFMRLSSIPPAPTPAADILAPLASPPVCADSS